MVGQTLGHYRIVEKLGAGGMGVVYRAHDERLNRDVAIKVLPPATLADESARKQFRKEALALAKLSHPNIGVIHDFDTQDGTDFLVMELIPGRALDQKLAGGALSEKELAQIGMQIAAALDEAHDRGVVHRDLKPGNVVVTPKGQVKVLDFGLAKLVHVAADAGATASVAETRAVTGTLPYMAPEQLHDEPVDARTDIYALGVVLYEIATGQRPFQQETGPRLTDAILHEAAPAPTRLQPRLAAEVERIILKCLEKDPENRYQTAKEVAVDLRRVIAPSSTMAVREPVPAARSWMASRWLWAAVALVMVLAAVAGYFQLRPTPTIDSVAVLPFLNASGDANLDYMSDGIAEELINRFTQVPALKVIARPTAFTYKGRQVRPEEVGQELRVGAVVMGKLVQRGDEVTVQVDLVNASDGVQLWGGRFARPAGEVHSLAGTIVEQIIQRLRPRLSDDERERLARRHTPSAEAYDLYLRGRYALVQYTGPKLRQSIEFFQQALARDPNLAAGWAGMAVAHTYLAMMEFEPPHTVMPKAREAALKALELDNTVAEAHTAMGIIKMVYNWDFPGAEAEFRKAKELSPGDVFARHWYVHYLEMTRNLDEAIAELERIVELDPYSAMYVGDLAVDYNIKRQPEKALRVTEKWVRSDTAYPFLNVMRAAAYEQMGKSEEALAEIARAQASETGAEGGRVIVGMLYPRLGKREEARKILSQLKQKSASSYVPAFWIASLSFALGNADEGFRYLEKAHEERSSNLLFLLLLDPLFDSVRKDPRYEPFMQRLNLPPDALR